MLIYVLLGIALIVGIWLISTYNFFVTAKTRIKAAIQEIGNQLKRQADLIPNLEESTKGYITHEKGIFDKLTEARKQINKAISSSDVAQMAEAGSQLSALLPGLKVIVEDNPELKASEVVTKLMDELRDTADKVMYSRRLVIDLTADYNVKKVTFPTSIVASIFKFAELPGLITPENGEFMKVGTDETKSPKIKL